MLAKLEQVSATMTATNLERAQHAVIVLPKTSGPDALRGVPCAETLLRALARRRKKPEDLAKSPIATDLPQGGLAAWVMLGSGQSRFEQLTAVRKALQLLMTEKPQSLEIGVFGTRAERQRAADIAVYAAWVNGIHLPERKKEREGNTLRSIRLFGHRSARGFAAGIHPFGVLQFKRIPSGRSTSGRALVPADRSA